MDDAIAGLLRVLITAVAHAWVVVLLGAIVVGNLYALVHAWRSGRFGWFAVIVLTGGGVATVVYLVTYHEEPIRSPAARLA